MSTGGEQGNGHSRNASISADGRYVAFESRAGNLVSGDTNRTTDVFVHDRESGQTERVSVSGDGSQGDKESTDPSISADGRFVAYASEAGNLVAGDTNREQDIFVHDRETGKTTRVSVASDGSEAEDDSQQSSISGDGRFVAFASEARNLVPGDTNRKQDIFVHDRETGETRRVSLSSGGTEGDRDGETPVISAQGRFVAFTSEARNLVAGDTNRKADVFVHDRQTGETTRVSVGNDGRQANGGSGAPSISASGRFVAFESVASGLVEGDKNKAKDVFVRDRSRELTIRISVGREGRPRDDSSSDDSSEEDGSSDDKSDDSSDGDSSDDSDDRGSGDSDHPFLSGDGAFVAFRSEASNLVHGDTNGRNDVFLAAVGLIPPPEVVDDERSTPAGTPIDIDVLANDTGDELSVTDATDPPNGTTIINSDNTITYTPDPGFSGLDSFEYTVTDSTGAQATGTVDVTVEPPTLTAADDDATTTSGQPVEIDVLENDSGTGLAVTDVTDPANGTAEILSGSSIRYTPDAVFVGSDIFEYTITDTDGATAVATVRVNVEAVPLVVENDEVSTIAGEPVTIDVLSNDSGTGLSVTGITDPANGTAEVNANNTIAYTPDGGFIGPDMFTYTVTDAAGGTATATVTVTVEPPPNLPPVGVDDEATTFETVAVIIEVLDNDSDPDNDPLTLESLTPPANGTAVISGATTVTYTPADGFRDVDSFSYTINDGRGATASATVTVDVMPDTVDPRITATVTPEPNAAGWNSSDVTVVFDCADDESGIESCSDPVTVTSEGADQDVTGMAVDRAGNTATSTVTVNVDKTPPSISLSGPSTARPGQSVTVSAAASDVLGLASVRFTVDGGDAGELTGPPFDLAVGIPNDAVTGSRVTVEAVATDLAGNTSTSTELSIDILGGGFVLGEVYNDSKGLPLAGVTVSIDGQSVLSNALGRFGFFIEAPTVLVRFERDGFTPVERVVGVNTLAGTLILDARLTPLSSTSTTIDSSGGTATAGSFELVVPSGALASATDFQLTELSGQGLRAPLPLGWSPAGSIQIDPEGVGFAVPAELRLRRTLLSGFELVLARYRTDIQSWVAEAVGLTGDGEVSAAISSSGAYAFVVVDTGSTAPPPA